MKRMPKRYRTYKCKHCGKAGLWRSDKKWVKSYCKEIGRHVHLMLVKEG